METKKQTKSKGVSAGLIILGSAIVASVFFFAVCGHPSHFDDKGHPLQGDVFGILYQGGYVIPLVITLLLTVLTLSIERLFALNRASGKDKNERFVVKVKQKIDEGDISGATRLCDDQKGSIANIVREGLVRYKDVEDIPNITNADKAELIQKEVDEATTLELPYLEKNLNIIAAISTLGTLFGLCNGTRRCTRLHRFGSRYLGSVDEYRSGYRHRCPGYYYLHLFFRKDPDNDQCRR